MRLSALVEPLETRQLLSVILHTDQPDYTPNSTAVITTTTDCSPDNNFQPGEVVQFHLDRTDGGTIQSPPAIRTWDVTDGVGGFTPHQDSNGMWWFPDTDGSTDGQIVTSFYVDPRFAGASLQLTATGLTSGAVATTDFTDANTRLTSVPVVAQSGIVTYGTVGSGTFAVTANRSSSGNQSATLYFINGTLPTGFTASFNTTTVNFSGNSSGSTTATLTISTTATYPAGSYNFKVKATDGPNSVTSNNFTFTVNTKALTVTANSTSKTYGQTVTFAGTEFSTSGLVNNDTVTSVTLTSSGAAATATMTAPGPDYAIVPAAASGSGLGNYTISYANGNLHVNAKALTVTANNASKTYDGAVFSPFTATISGFVNGENSSVVSGIAGFTGNATTAVNAGSYTITPTAGSLSATNYNFSAGNLVNGTLTIGKATSTTTATGGSFTYDGTTRTGGSGTVTGAGGLSTSATSLTYTGDQIDAGTYYVTAHYAGDANHLPSDGAAVAIVIDKASSTTTASDAGGTYDGSAFPDTSAVTGAGGLSTVADSLDYHNTDTSTDLGSTAPIDAGHYTVIATYNGNANHTGSSSAVSFTIAKANATFSLTPYSVTYDAAAHTATGTVSAVGPVNQSDLHLGGTTHTNVGSYSDAWVFTDTTGNYNDAAGKVTDAIGKANATVSVAPYGVTYDGKAHVATGKVTGVDGQVLAGLNLSGTVHVNAGTYADSWSFSDASGNYNYAAGSVTDVIRKANAVIIVSPYNE